MSQVTLQPSENSEAERLKLLRARNTSKKLRAFRMHLESVPAALQSQSRKIVPLGELARTLGVAQSRLLPAIEHGYLKLASATPPMVYEPPPAAIEWLRIMFQPLVLRPFLGSEMVADIEGIPVASVRQLCLDYNIPIYSDPVFGELMSMASFYRFHAQMHHQREPSRFDRQALVVALMQAVDPSRYRDDFSPPTYSLRLEREIRRIAKLEEPARTDAALRFLDAYGDAKRVVDCLTAARGVSAVEFRQINRIRKLVEVEAPPTPSEEDDGQDPE